MQFPFHVYFPGNLSFTTEAQRIQRKRGRQGWVTCASCFASRLNLFAQLAKTSGCFISGAHPPGDRIRIGKLLIPCLSLCLCGEEFRVIFHQNNMLYWNKLLNYGGCRGIQRLERERIVKIVLQRSGKILCVGLRRAPNGHDRWIKNL